MHHRPLARAQSAGVSESRKAILLPWPNFEESGPALGYGQEQVKCDFRRRRASLSQHAHFDKRGTKAV
jgi:hypothetical protein